jgi:hypothetical protein
MAAVAAATTYNESSSERSLLFSDDDSEQESISHDNTAANSNNDDDDNNSMQWEDFMVRYWDTKNDNDHGGNDEEEEFQIADNADQIVRMENTDMIPHSLEPELDYFYSDELLFQTTTATTAAMDYVDTMKNDNYNDIALMKILRLSDVGLQCTLQMAKSKLIKLVLSILCIHTHG